MKKSEARNIAVDYLYNAASAFYDISRKITIDDKGTLSDDGYVDEDCDKIQVELDFIMKKVLKLKSKKSSK